MGNFFTTNSISFVDLGLSIKNQIISSGVIFGNLYLSRNLIILSVIKCIETFLLSFYFGGLYPWHMEVPGQLWQHWILNLLSHRNYSRNSIFNDHWWKQKSSFYNFTHLVGGRIFHRLASSSMLFKHYFPSTPHIHTVGAAHGGTLRDTATSDLAYVPTTLSLRIGTENKGCMCSGLPLYGLY